MPLDTTGLLLDYDATLGVTASGGRVSQINDQSGNGYHATQATGAFQPYVTTDPDGDTVIRFNEDDITRLTVDPACTVLGNSVSIFIVGGKFLAGSVVSLQSWAGSGSHLQVTKLTNTTRPKYTAANNRNSTLVPHMNRQVLGVVAGSTVNMFSNLGDSLSLGGNNADATPRTINIGVTKTGNSSGGSFEFNRILIYNVVKTTLEAQAIVAYLSTLYRVATSYPKQVLCVGNSTVYSIGATGVDAGTGWPYFMLDARRRRRWKVINVGVTGSKISDQVARLEGINAIFDSGLAANCNRQICEAGKNDCTVADNSATVYSDLVSYCEQAKAASWDLRFATPAASNNGTQPTVDLFKDKVYGRSGNGLIADAGTGPIIGLGEDSHFDQASDNSNGMYADTLHNNGAGYLYQGVNIFRPTLEVEQMSVANVADGSTYDLGPVPVNVNVSVQFTIRNDGSQDDVLGTLAISGTGWSIDAGDNPSGNTVTMSGGTKTVTVKGNFASTGAKTGTLTITSNDPLYDSGHPYTINLAATAANVTSNNRKLVTMGCG